LAVGKWLYFCAEGQVSALAHDLLLYLQVTKRLKGFAAALFQKTGS
jgi:hypothetical protein